MDSILEQYRIEIDQISKTGTRKFHIYIRQVHGQVFLKMMNRCVIFVTVVVNNSKTH